MIWLVSRPEARPVTCMVFDPDSEESVRPVELEVDDDETELVDMGRSFSVRQGSTEPAARSSTARGVSRCSGAPEASVSSHASCPETSSRSKRTCRPVAARRSQASCARAIASSTSGGGDAGMSPERTSVLREKRENREAMLLGVIERTPWQLERHQLDVHGSVVAGSAFGLRGDRGGQGVEQ